MAFLQISCQHARYLFGFSRARALYPPNSCLLNNRVFDRRQFKSDISQQSAPSHPQPPSTAHRSSPSPPPPPPSTHPPSPESKNISSSNRPISDGGPFTWRSVLMGGSILAVLTGYFMYIKNERAKKIEREKTRTFGKAAIGGSFELIDTDGKLRKSEEFSGKWNLIYFGFTHCPDVCPEELEKLSKVVENLTKDGFEIFPLFISVDPERDTPELVGKYLKEFSDKFIGLTGSKEQVEKATRAYRVYYSVGPRDKDNDYIVDHTIISYLVDPKGELVDYFGQTREADDIEKAIRFKIKTTKS